MFSDRQDMAGWYVPLRTTGSEKRSAAISYSPSSESRGSHVKRDRRKVTDNSKICEACDSIYYLPFATFTLLMISLRVSNVTVI